MVRVDFFVFGYRTVSVNEDNTEKLINLFLRNNVKSFSVGSDGFVISARDYQRIKDELSKLDAKIGVGKGLTAMLDGIKKRKAQLLALAAVLILNLLSSQIVFDVRVDGNDDIPDYVIVEALKGSGLDIGRFWSTLDVNAIEASALSSIPEISWININRRGSVAYVEVAKRKDAPSDGEEDGRVSNIVADRDCVISEITVESGVAMVKPGDVVKRGDILISGTVETEFGTQFVRASGYVTGETVKSLTTNVEKNERIVIERSTRLYEIRLNILKISLNIFKNSRNSAEECDIIVNNEKILIPPDAKLPLGITKIYTILNKYEDVEYTDSRMINIARERHRALLVNSTSGDDLIKISTEGKFTETGYSLSSRIVYSSEVGEEKIITLGKAGV